MKWLKRFYQSDVKKRTNDYWQKKVSSFDSSTLTDGKNIKSKDYEEQANKFLRESNFALAIVELEHQLDINPISSFSLYNLGIAYKSVDNIFGALDALKASLICEPIAPAVYRKIGYIYNDLGKLGEAIENFGLAVSQQQKYGGKIFIKNDNDHIKTHLIYNFCLERNNQWSEAILSWKKLIEKEPNHPFHHIALAFAFMMSNEDDKTNLAISEANKARELDAMDEYGIKERSEEFVRQVNSLIAGGSFMWRNNDGEIILLEPML